MSSSAEHGQVPGSSCPQSSNQSMSELEERLKGVRLILELKYEGSDPRIPSEAKYSHMKWTGTDEDKERVVLETLNEVLPKESRDAITAWSNDCLTDRDTLSSCPSILSQGHKLYWTSQRSRFV